ncbi:hypothetical protein BCR34DRAFT_17312 [Clohesyomyces aquaticus]|uniref:Uncharacterized protein n=1 Tax=Clohesyomyces aquaticus TaxID=1231657 RepID=A0A1Y1ZDA1_9PLEO|nr:hypothetical protein BCR34DRAFT_17312 [Clohesyomyces aquaticus]
MTSPASPLRNSHPEMQHFEVLASIVGARRSYAKESFHGHDTTYPITWIIVRSMPPSFDNLEEKIMMDDVVLVHEHDIIRCGCAIRLIARPCSPGITTSPGRKAVVENRYFGSVAVGSSFALPSQVAKPGSLSAHNGGAMDKIRSSGSTSAHRLSWQVGPLCSTGTCSSRPSHPIKKTSGAPGEEEVWRTEAALKPESGFRKLVLRSATLGSGQGSGG